MTYILVLLQFLDLLLEMRVGKDRNRDELDLVLLQNRLQKISLVHFTQKLRANTLTVNILNAHKESVSFDTNM